MRTSAARYLRTYAQCQLQKFASTAGIVQSCRGLHQDARTVNPRSRVQAAIPPQSVDLQHVPSQTDTRRTSRTLEEVAGGAEAAKREMRWIVEHAEKLHGSDVTLETEKKLEWEIKRMLLERRSGKPLQYILGNQPFGDLEILCRERVLIPRLVPQILCVKHVLIQLAGQRLSLSSHT